MKRITLVFIIMLGILPLRAGNLLSPDKQLELKAGINNKSEIIYALSYKGKEIIKPSKLGLELKNAPSLLEGFTLKNTKESSFDETWKPVWGEVSEIRNHYNELLLEFEQKATERTIKIRFRLFNDGLGFRYEFDKQKNLNYFRVADERTEFVLTGDHKAFWIPGDYDTNEYYYTATIVTGKQYS